MVGCLVEWLVEWLVDWLSVKLLQCLKFKAQTFWSSVSDFYFDFMDKDVEAAFTCLLEDVLHLPPLLGFIPLACVMVLQMVCFL